MKRFNFNQTGGFKFTTETLSNIQDAYSIIEGVGRMAGNMAIISGCNELAGTQVSDGIVIINGELLEFQAGIKQNTVIIREEKESIKFQNGEVKEVVINRYAMFGFSNIFYPWDNFKRVTPLNTIEERLSKLEKAAKPIIDGNTPVLFMKPLKDIPPGWEEVTEFRGRMPLGLNPDDGDFNEIMKPGGNKNHELTISELPEHRFRLFGGPGINTSKINNNPDSAAAYQGDSPSANEDWNYEITSTGGEALFGQTNSIGQNQPFDLINPYRIVVYIRFKG